MLTKTNYNRPIETNINLFDMAKDDTAALSVRLPLNLKKLIEKDAEENERSINSQIVMVLKNYYLKRLELSQN